jgi:dolichol-phosphate mannosyltransferase
MKLSIVSPVYRAEKIVPALVERIEKAVSPITSDYEIILVEDHGPDNSWAVIESIARKNKKVIGIELSRNFGQHYAITAGLKYAKGEWVIVMDCDLQDNPDEIPNLYNKAIEGFDIVYARRVERQDSFFKRLSSSIFHSVFHFLSGQRTDKTVANFGIYNHKVIAEFNKMKERARSFPSLVSYLGFKISAIEVVHSNRYEGDSSYSFRKLLKLTSDVILSNSNRPLKLAVQIGFTISTFSFLLAIYNVIAYLAGIIMVPGYTTTVFSIWFVGGLILFMLGIVGLYIGKIFDQVKERQLYIVDQTINLEEDGNN